MNRELIKLRKQLIEILNIEDESILDLNDCGFIEAILNIEKVDESTIKLLKENNIKTVIDLLEYICPQVWSDEVE